MTISQNEETHNSNTFKPNSGWKIINDWEHVVNQQQQQITKKTKLNTTESFSVPSSPSKAVADYSDLIPTFDKSPVEKCLVRDRILYLKRDDLLRLPNSNVSGNKARKLFALNVIPPKDFPKLIISYGGPQSNAMLAIAAIVHSKNMENNNTDTDTNKTPHKFIYYTKKLPRWLRKTPSGNFIRAISLGMEIIELSPKQYTELFGGEDGGNIYPPSDLEPPKWAWGDTLWIPQGGACGVSIPGVTNLANEIRSFWTMQSKSSSLPLAKLENSEIVGTKKEKNTSANLSNSFPGHKLAVCIPGGTCTTALFLQRALNQHTQILSLENSHYNNNGFKHDDDIIVVAIPCVGDSEYAQRQMISLDLSTGGDGKSNIPHVLTPPPIRQHQRQLQRHPHSNNSHISPRTYYTFGRPHADILSTYFEMKDEHDIYLDLLYGSSAWTMMLQHWESMRLSSTTGYISPLAGREIMYVHSGGLEGNASQMTRYKQNGLLSPEQAM